MSSPLYPVVILAGGFARRLGPLAQDVPKALMDVNGEPFLAHQLRLLRSHSIQSVVLCVGHLGEQVRAAMGDGAALGVQLRYSFDGPRPLGTGGAVQHALPQVSGDAFFVLYGDSYLECDYAAVQRSFAAEGKRGLMTVFGNEERWDASNVEFADGRIRAYDKIHRTERMRHIDYGLGVLHKEAFVGRLQGTAWDLAGLYQALLAADQLAAFEVGERFYEIGSMAGLEEIRHYLAARPGSPDAPRA
jgi:NDP-sugar pyrophosphorylase family protein